MTEAVRPTLSKHWAMLGLYATRQVLEMSQIVVKYSSVATVASSSANNLLVF